MLPLSKNRVASLSSEIKCGYPDKKRTNMPCEFEISAVQNAGIDFSEEDFPKTLEDLYQCIYLTKHRQNLLKPY